MSEQPENSDEIRSVGEVDAGSDEARYDEVENEFEELLSEQFGIVRADLGVTPEQHERSEQNASSALLRITSTPRAASQTGARRAPTRRVRWSPRATWAVAAAAVVATIAVVVTVAIPGTPTPAAYATTPQLLEIRSSQAVDYPLTGTDPTAALSRLAETAEAHPGFGTGDTQIVTRVGWWLDADEARPGQRRVVPTQSEVRQLPNDTTRIVVRREEPLRQGATTIEPTEGPVTSDEVFPRDPESPFDHPERLPTDPDELATVLLGSEDACLGFRAYCLAEMISTLNLNFVPTPALEAGLIRTLSGAGDITYTGTARDRLGRQVEVFAVDDPDRQRQYLLMFDPNTGYFVGRETVLLVDQPDLEDIQVPAVIEFDAVSARLREDNSRD